MRASLEMIENEYVANLQKLHDYMIGFIQKPETVKEGLKAHDWKAFEKEIHLAGVKLRNLQRCYKTEEALRNKEAE